MDPVARLFGLERFGIKLGLENIRVLLAELGHPEAAWPSVHVAGTNGKGSVAAMVERAFRASDLRTGRYTSPHLSEIEERVAINGIPVPASMFALATSDVLATIDRAIAAGRLPVTPTFFEVSTAIAFEIFRRERVDVAVVEVGLGGRFDATNTLSPTVTAITSIALDHERHLGSTLRSIAFEKAGIAKPGIPLIVGPMTPDAADVIADVARTVGAPLVNAYDGVEVTTSSTLGRATISLTTPSATHAPVTLALAGRHQVSNAVVAVRVLEAWSERATPVPADAIATGLADCEWPGRLEWLRLPTGAEVLIDAAHNPSGAAALADYLRDAGVAPLPIVFTAMRDKDVKGMLAPLVPLASTFFATTVSSSRAREVESLARDIMRVIADVSAPSAESVAHLTVNKEMNVVAEASPDIAVARALREHPRVVVAGSIFLIGPVRAHLLEGGASRL